MLKGEFDPLLGSDAIDAEVLRMITEMPEDEFDGSDMDLSDEQRFLPFVRPHGFVRMRSRTWSAPAQRPLEITEPVESVCRGGGRTGQSQRCEAHEILLFQVAPVCDCHREWRFVTALVQRCVGFRRNRRYGALFIARYRVSPHVSSGKSPLRAMEWSVGNGPVDDELGARNGVVTRHVGVF